MIAAVSLGCSGTRGRSATITWLRRGPRCAGSTLLTKHSHVLSTQEGGVNTQNQTRRFELIAHVFNQIVIKQSACGVIDGYRRVNTFICGYTWVSRLLAGGLWVKDLGGWLTTNIWLPMSWQTFSFQLHNQYIIHMQFPLWPQSVSVRTDWQQSRGKSSLYRRPVRSVVIILTLTELMCLEPISRIRAITLVNACTQNGRTLSHDTNDDNYIINHIEAFVVSCRQKLSLTSFLRSFSPALELSSCMLKKARIPSSFGCK